MIKYCCSEMDDLSVSAIHEGCQSDTFFLSVYKRCKGCGHSGEHHVKITHCPFCGKKIEPEKRKAVEANIKAIDSLIKQVDELESNSRTDISDLRVDLEHSKIDVEKLWEALNANRKMPGL